MKWRRARDRPGSDADGREAGVSEERGIHVRSGWGDGDTLSEYAPGDVVWIPEYCVGVTERRCRPGLARVLSVFSIDDGPSFYYRTQPMEVRYSRGYRLRVTDPSDCSGRLHVIRDMEGVEDLDCTDGWVLLYAAPPQQKAQAEEPEPVAVRA